MKGFILLVIAATAIASSAEFSEETLMMDVTSSIATMKKKGATEADCKDLAKTTCKEVVSERKSDQIIINKLQTGRHCVHKGQGGVTKAQVHYKKMKKVLTKAQIEVTNASNLKVSITSQRFKSLKVGHCGFIFSSRSYLSAKAKYTRAQRIVVKYKGIVSEAWKRVVTMKKTAARMVKNCHCRTKATYWKTWKVVTNKKRVARQNKAYAKCKMMACVLNGTPSSSSKCKGSLTKLVKKKLTSATERVTGCKGVKCPPITRQHCPHGRVYKNGCPTSICKKKKCPPTTRQHCPHGRVYKNGCPTSICKKKKGVICQPSHKKGKVALDVTIVIDGSGSVGSSGWAYSVKAAKKMAASFGAGSRVSAAVFSNEFKWLTKPKTKKYGPCPDKRLSGITCAKIAANMWCSKKFSSHWKHNQQLCPKSCKTGKRCEVEGMTFTSPEKAAAAVALARWPKGSTRTADALTKTISHIKSRGSKGAKQVVYVITDGVPNSISETTKAAAKLRKMARLAFVPVGKGAPVKRIQTWASKPVTKNVFYAKDFKALSSQLTKAVKSTCTKA